MIDWWDELEHMCCYSQGLIAMHTFMVKDYWEFLWLLPLWALEHYAKTKRM